MTAQERAAEWGRLLSFLFDASDPKWSLNHRIHLAGLALDAYESLKEADTLETLDEMAYDAECVIRQQWEARRCGTCRWWDTGPFTTVHGLRIDLKGKGLCACAASECCSPSQFFSTDHGCPHHERKDGAE